MSWNPDKEKLLCFLKVDDALGEAMTGVSGLAFWRAFIVEDRATGKVRALYRFRYPNEKRNWYEMTALEKSGQEAMAYVKCALEDIINETTVVYGLPFKVEAFYPPDDGGDGNKTVIWLEQNDLIEIQVEPLDGSDGTTDIS